MTTLPQSTTKKLGLAIEPVSTQVIPRDRHAMYFAVLGVIASSVERLATEVRHLQRTEVLEAEEFFSAGQKGSSAMPHKQNPVTAERLVTLARFNATLVSGMHQAQLHEMERSGAAWMLEWMLLPQMCETAGASLLAAAALIQSIEKMGKSA